MKLLALIPLVTLIGGLGMVLYYKRAENEADREMKREQQKLEETSRVMDYVEDRD